MNQEFHCYFIDELEMTNTSLSLDLNSVLARVSITLGVIPAQPKPKSQNTNYCKQMRGDDFSACSVMHWKKFR